MANEDRGWRLDRKEEGTVVTAFSSGQGLEHDATRVVRKARGAATASEADVFRASATHLQRCWAFHKVVWC